MDTQIVGVFEVGVLKYGFRSVFAMEHLAQLCSQCTPQPEGRVGLSFDSLLFNAMDFAVCPALDSLSTVACLVDLLLFLVLWIAVSRQGCSFAVWCCIVLVHLFTTDNAGFLWNNFAQCSGLGCKRFFCKDVLAASTRLHP
jgi:hypothetical protein